MSVPEFALEQVGVEPAPADGDGRGEGREVSHAGYLATTHFGSLDGIRCFCILAVILHHVPDPAGLPRAANYSFLGVDMFFALSGFLIVTLLLRERGRTGTIRLSGFYARRSLRIFPIYYGLLFGLLAILLATQPGSETTRVFLAELPYYLTYTCNWIVIAGSNLDVLWSLATEEQFYLAWPLVEKLCRPRTAVALLLGVIAANQWVNFGFADAWIARAYPSGVVPPIFHTTFTPIALGALLAHGLDNARSFSALVPVLGRRWSPLLLGSLLILLVQYAPEDISGWPRLSIQVVMTLLIGSVAIREDHLARPLLTWAPIRRVGMISYGIYLYHKWVIHLVRAVSKRSGGIDEWAFLVATVVLSVAAAEASFRLVEAPLLRLRTRFRS